MKLKDLLKNKFSEQQALLNKAIAENRAMSTEEQTKFDALEVEIKNLENTILNQEKIDAKIKAQAEADVLAKTPVNDPIFAQPKGNKSKWNGFGEFLGAVAKSAAPGAEIDNRLFNATGLNTNVNSEGGFLVEEDFISGLMQKSFAEAVLASRCYLQPIGPNSNGVRMNGIDENSRVDGSRYGGIQTYWASQAGTVAASKPKFKEISLKLEKLMSFVWATEEQLQDSVQLESWVNTYFPKSNAFSLDTAIYSGTGAGTALGVLNSGALVTVAKELGQAANTILFENIIKMWSRMIASSRNNAAWFINQDIEPQLFAMSLAVGTGGMPVYMPAGGISGQPYSTLLGRPIIPIEQASTLGTVGDIVLADMSQYMLIEKGGVKAASSIHVQFMYDESVFRFTHRVNGMPLWEKPLTPFKGTNTLSPFVALATRS